MPDIAAIGRSNAALRGVVLRFYAVGLGLFMLPFTRSIFVSITSLSLLLVFVAAFLFNRDWRAGTVIWFLFIVLSSFFLEMEGVASGAVFGEYAYERGLAPLVKGTPLIIGFNWLFLVYASRNIIMKYTGSRTLHVVGGAALMLAYDTVLEWAAPYMEMWSFAGGYPPLRNFAVWAAAALIYHAGMELLRVQGGNAAARCLFIVQFAFLFLVALFSTLFTV